MEAGALDAALSPLQMKKNRPGSLLRVIAKPEDQERLAQIIFAETSTLGLRIHAAERRVEARSMVEVETPYGPIRGKVSAQGAFAPEFDDCKAIAQRTGTPLPRVSPPPTKHISRTDEQILPNDADLLRQRRSAYRPHLHHHRRRCDQASETHAGLRAGDPRPPAPTSTARRSSAPPRRPTNRRRSSPTSSPTNSASSGRRSTCRSTVSSAPPIPSTPKSSRICSIAASKAATSTRAVHRRVLRIVSYTSPTPSPAILARIADAPPKPSPKRISTSSSRRSRSGCSSSTKTIPTSSARNRAAMKSSPS